MEKKYIIVVCVVMAAWIGFMLFRSMKQDQEAAKYYEQRYKQLTEIAQKMPRAGLREMAMALNKYYQKAGVYPKELMELYPDYIPSEQFIKEVAWEYTPQSDNFDLAKAIEVKNKIVVASIDKNLVPRLESEETVMVAAVDKKTQRSAKKSPVRKGEPEPEEAEEEMEYDEIPETPLSYVEESSSASPALPPGPNILPPPEKTKTAPPPKEQIERWQTETVQIVSFGKDRHESKLAARVGRKYYVWKDGRGNLGFSNMEYPEKEEITIYSRDQWLNIKRSGLNKAADATFFPESSHKKKDLDEIAARFSRKYVAWKNQDGSVGFGDLQYLGNQSQYVYASGKWQPIRKPVLKEAPSAQQNKEIKRENKRLRINRKFFTWKDEDGHMGFGNVEYPESDVLFIYNKDRWIKIKTRLPKRIEPMAFMAEKIADSRKGPDVGRLSDRGRFLAWKDKGGHLGFGNVDYPDENISNIHIDGTWQNIPKK